MGWAGSFMGVPSVLVINQEKLAKDEAVYAVVVTASRGRVVAARAQTYAGATLVSAGTFNLAGNIPNSDLTVAASTSYSYRVRAEDAVPNLGPYSNVASAAS